MKVVVLSKSYEAALGIARALKMSVFKNVDLMFIGTGWWEAIACASNVFNKKVVIPTRTEEEIVQKLIELYSKTTAKEKIVLFTADDYTTSLSDRYRDQLESVFLMPYVDGHKNGAITHLMDKDFQMETATKFGLKTAKSWVAAQENSKYIIPEGVIYPCFVKPLVSANGWAKANIAKCVDEKALSEHLKKVVESGERNPLLIQEFIEITDEYTIHGICDGNRVFIPIVHKKLETAKFNKGVTLLGENLNPSVLESHLERLKQLFLSLGYHGPFDVEVFFAGEQLYLNEINVRISGPCWGVIEAGANLPKLWVQCLLGEVDDWPNWDIKFGTVFINDKTAYEDFVGGFITKRQFRKWNKKADYHLLKNENDPKPFKIFKRIMERRRVKQVIKNLLGR